MKTLLMLLALQVILPGPPKYHMPYELPEYKDLFCKDYFVATTVKLSWDPVPEQQTVLLTDQVFPHDVPQTWNMTSYMIHISKNTKYVNEVSVAPPATSTTYKISANATTGGNYCFRLYYRGYIEFEKKPRQETWHSEIVVQTLPVGYHTLAWPPPLGVEYDGFQVRATTDPAFIDNWLLVAGETANESDPSVTFFVARPYTVYQKISAVKILTPGPLPKAPGRMTVTRLP